VPLKIAIAGSGYIAVQNYYPAFRREDIQNKMVVSAVCDPVPGRAAEHCKRFQLGIPYTDYDDMLSKAPIDVVAILSPIPYHFEQAKKALLAGKHVYVQKTMSVTSAEAMELNHIAREQGCILCASPGQMIEPSHVKAKELIDRGALGKICFARGQGPHPGHENQELFGIDPSWYYKPGGGPLMDVAVYPITSITGFMGPAKRVSAFSGIALPNRFWNGKKIGVSMDDNTVLLLDFGGGALASIQGNFCSRKVKTPQIELYGEKGTLLLGGWCDSGNPLELYTEEPLLGHCAGWYKPQTPLNSLPEPYTMWTVADLLHVVDCAKKGCKPGISGDQAAHVIEIIEKAYLSAKSGRAETLSTGFVL
jgi:predicted dehydrogenase